MEFFRFNLNDLDELKNRANKKIKKVKEMLDECEKNIYKNISGHEDEINYFLYDCGEKVTGLVRHIISLTELFPGKVNGEYKMTTGHFHLEEELYIFLGKGKLILRHNGKEENYDMLKGDSITIPLGVWHRVVNTQEENLNVFCMFEKYEGRG